MVSMHLSNTNSVDELNAQLGGGKSSTSPSPSPSPSVSEPASFDVKKFKKVCKVVPIKSPPKQTRRQLATKAATKAKNDEIVREVTRLLQIQGLRATGNNSDILKQELSHTLDNLSKLGALNKPEHKALIKSEILTTSKIVAPPALAGIESTSTQPLVSPPALAGIESTSTQPLVSPPALAGLESTSSAPIEVPPTLAGIESTLNQPIALIIDDVVKPEEPDEGPSILDDLIKRDLLASDHKSELIEALVIKNAGHIAADKIPDIVEDRISRHKNLSVRAISTMVSDSLKGAAKHASDEEVAAKIKEEKKLNAAKKAQETRAAKKLAKEAAEKLTTDEATSLNNEIKEAEDVLKAESSKAVTVAQGKIIKAAQSSLDKLRNTLNIHREAAAKKAKK